MNRYKIYVAFIVLGFLHQWKAGAQNILFENASIHTGNGRHIAEGFILVQDGKILELGAGDFAGDVSGYRRIDVEGRELYPGIIALNTQLGLKEIDAVRATRDYDEVGSFNANLRSIIAYNTDSEVVKTVRSAGVLMAQVTPRGGRISGRSTVVKLEAWNWEDAAIRMEDGVHLNWPNFYRARGWWANPQSHKKNDKYKKAVDELLRYFAEAESYCQGSTMEKDLGLGGLCDVLGDEAALYIHVDDAVGMMDALDFCSRYGLDPIFYGARDARKILELLKEKEVKLVLKRVKSLPSRIDGPLFSAYALPADLYAAGIPFAIADNGSWEQRNVIYQAAQAVAYGLPYEEAIRALTLRPAEITGVAEDRGSLERGKHADLIIVDGDLLEIGSSMVKQAFFNGRELDLSDKQKALYEKYLDKYGLE